MLGHTDFGLDDSFFEVGGHSLLAAALVRELSRRFGNRAYIHDIYRTPSVRQLAASLARRAGERRRRWTANRPGSCNGTCACPPTWISAAPWTPPNCWRHGTSCSPAPAG
ncbi:acyl carrier protein [Pseudomonas aeruginosa]|nr:acyl carrier protein [Pseudomonas aeruginosa]